MCLIHDSSKHYLYQDIMVAFEQSKMLSSLFMRRVAYLICTCQRDYYCDSKTIISRQRTLYQWFDESLQDTQRSQASIAKLNGFKAIINEFKQNGSIDSGTKIIFMTLLRDIDSLNFYKLRTVGDKNKYYNNNNNKRIVFYAKLIKLKFDLKLCSAKEFIDTLSKIDNCAIKYIQTTTKSKITLRDLDHLTIRNFMGEVEATIESRSEKNLRNAEFYLKRLADALHYRLVKQLPSSDSIIGANSLNSLKILLQSPPESSFETSGSSADLTNSYSLKSNSTTDYSCTSTSTGGVDVSSVDFSKNISSSLSSNTLNGDHNDSILSVSRHSMGSSTPLTSSPVSSSSSAKFVFKYVKKSNGNSNANQNNKKSTQKNENNKKPSDIQNNNEKTAKRTYQKKSKSTNHFESKQNDYQLKKASSLNVCH